MRSPSPSPERWPTWTPGTALWQIATQLREASFRSQAAAARHFGVAHTTISRYEGYELGSKGLKPPFSYLAALAVYWDVTAPPPGDPTRPVHLVAQLEAVRRRFYAADATPPVQTWADLGQYAAMYPPRPVPPPAEEPAPWSFAAGLERAVYAVLAPLMRGDGAGLQELLVLLGLVLGSWPLLVPLFALPPDPSDRGALLHGAVGVVLALAILPCLIGGGAIGLAVLRTPAWRSLPRVTATARAVMAYGGAGYGILTALTLLGLVTLILHYMGWSAGWIAPLLQSGALLGVVWIGVVFAGRFMAVYALYRPVLAEGPAPRLTGGECLVGCAPAIVGPMAGGLLVADYDLLLDWGIGLGLLSAVLIGLTLWQARSRVTNRGTPDAGP